MHLALVALLWLAVAAPALAGEPPAFRDDRSDPAALIRSYYNAIARHEYARAWSYFGDTPPVADYPGFVAGFARTASVELRLGPVTTEGAAGSTYGTVPVAITATDPDGVATRFTGCYTTRQIQPAIQEPPFRPLGITRGRLRQASGTDDAPPTTCGP